MVGGSFLAWPEGGVFSRADGLVFVGGDGEISDVGERGGPPHWLMKDSTALYGQPSMAREINNDGGDRVPPWLAPSCTFPRTARARHIAPPLLSRNAILTELRLPCPI